MKIPVALCSDKKYAVHLATAISSIVRNAGPDDKLDFRLVVSGNFPPRAKRKIARLCRDHKVSFITVDADGMFAHLRHTIRKNDIVSLMTYMRLLLPRIITDLDKIIYLDTDIIVASSLAGLISHDLGGRFLGMVLDTNGYYHSLRLGTDMYFNAGVLLMNLEKIREYNISGHILSYINRTKYKIVLHDQDILNSMFRGHIAVLPQEWNVQLYPVPKIFDSAFGPLIVPKIYHFILIKPWKWRYGRPCPHRWLYWKYRLGL